GNKFEITARNNSEQNRYIQTASLGGTVYERGFLTHDQIMSGGSMIFEMNDQPNKVWGNNNPDLFSMRPVDEGVLMPYISSEGETFYDSLRISLSCATPGTKIRYTTDGSEPGFTSTLYEKPATIFNSTTIRAFSYIDRSASSFIMSASFTKSKYPPAVYTVKYHERYNGGGGMALTDGRFGTKNFQNGEWQGFEGNDLEAVIDLTRSTSIKKLSIGFLNDPNVWIFLPREVIFSISQDGENFKRVADILNDIPSTSTDNMIKKFSAEVDVTSARYLKVTAKNIGVCPAWHKGAGEKAWIFADEVVIE
ncbi:MAG: chitobiase/beta-hexosaminidase C-terminal domain-containing protein, partial [Melioribacteraceae bacterium]